MVAAAAISDQPVSDDVTWRKLNVDQAQRPTPRIAWRHLSRDTTFHNSSADVNADVGQ